MTRPDTAWCGTVRIIGPGRAGRSFASVLEQTGWSVTPTLGRDDDPRDAAHGVDLVVIATPDSLVASTARSIEVNRDALVVHLAGSLGLDVLAPHPRRGAIHPLAALPDATSGARRLRSGIWFAIDADDPEDLDRLGQLVESCNGRFLVVPDNQRAAYHAAAVIASNHLVALMGQLERISERIGLPVEPFVELAIETLHGVAENGARASLTGPVARGDWATVARHLDALDPAERPAYGALANAALTLVGSAEPPPDWLVDVSRGRPLPDVADGALATDAR